MELKTMIIMLLAFSGVIVGLNTYVADLAPQYSKNIDDMSILSQASVIEQNVKDMETAFSSHVTGTLLDIPISAVTGGIEFVKLIFVSTVGFWSTFINSSAIAHYLFLPDWFAPIISAIVMTLVIFAAYHAIKWGY